MPHASDPQPVEDHVQAAWEAELAATVETPGLHAELVRRRHELFPRFAAAYLELQTLPRRVRRALQRQWRLPLVTLALWLVLAATPVQAATITVGGACTLVDAITAANADVATGGCRAGRGADTIVLPAGSLQKLTKVNNSTYGPTGLPVIRSVITIVGNGSTIARTRGEPFRILTVNSGGKLTLRETTVSGGETPPDRSGGGVANYEGSLAVFNSTISGNSASYAGGGVLNVGYGTVTVTNSTIVGNSVSGYFGLGGGVDNQGGSLIVTNSTISGNSATGSSGLGGGVASHDSGAAAITNSTISGNSAPMYAGGGLAIFRDGFATVTNSTISGNSAAFGGGVATGYKSGLTLVSTLLSGNTAATGSGPEIWTNYFVGANNHNLFGVNGIAGVAGFTPGPTDIVPPAGVLLADILEPTLADNGGPSQTHALVPGSPAIDAGGPVCLDANGEALTTDQRGQPRPVDGDGDGVVACDIGAFELQP